MMEAVGRERSAPSREVVSFHLCVRAFTKTRILDSTVECFLPCLLFTAPAPAPGRADAVLGAPGSGVNVQVVAPSRIVGQDEIQ